MASDKRKKQTKSPAAPVAATGKKSSLPVKMDTPSKKNGVKMEEIETEVESIPRSAIQNTMPPQTPQRAMPIQYITPTNQSAAPGNGKPTLHQLMPTLVPYVLKHNPNIIPVDPTKQPITSAHINAVAHAMWQIAFRHGGFLQRASQYGSMFSPLKLAALARLNYLPSWWYFRSLVVTDFREPSKSWWVDDREEEEVWEETLRWCLKVLDKRMEKEGGVKGKQGVKGDGNNDNMEE